jgi:hypothetical protein
MQTHIAKALQTWSHAIRNALERYNTAAAKLHPPWEILTYGTIIEYSFVGDFSLLKTRRYPTAGVGKASCPGGHDKVFPT